MTYIRATEVTQSRLRSAGSAHILIFLGNGRFHGCVPSWWIYANDHLIAPALGGVDSFFDVALRIVERSALSLSLGVRSFNVLGNWLATTVTLTILSFVVWLYFIQLLFRANYLFSSLPRQSSQGIKFWKVRVTVRCTLQVKLLRVVKAGYEGIFPQSGTCFIRHTRSTV